MNGNEKWISGWVSFLVSLQDLHTSQASIPGFSHEMYCAIPNARARVPYPLRPVRSKVWGSRSAWCNWTKRSARAVCPGISWNLNWCIFCGAWVRRILVPLKFWGLSSRTKSWIWNIGIKLRFANANPCQFVSPILKDLIENQLDIYFISDARCSLLGQNWFNTIYSHYLCHLYIKSHYRLL